LGLEFENVSFRTADGLKLEGWFVPAPSAKGTIVYCHGYGENRGQCLMLLQDLHKMPYNVLAFDFRGHGTSEGHTVTFGHREVEDIKAACAEAQRLGDGAPVLIVGVSYGAGVALQSLSQVPYVAGVWADSAFAELDDIVGRNFGFLPQDGRRAFVAVINALVRVDCGFWPSRVNTADSLRGLSTPIFFCHGKNDSDTPFEDARRVFEAYEGHKGHYWIDDDSETALSDFSKRDYSRRMKAFFAKALEIQTSAPSEREEL
jgi:pimeloyl-ACP methyl ester carboxylesterase